MKVDSIVVNLANRPPSSRSARLERLVAEVTGLADDELVDLARHLGIPDPYGLTRARLEQMVAGRLR